MVDLFRMRIQERNVNGLSRPGWWLAALTLVSQFSGTLGLTLNLCSSQNTGSSTTPDVSIYQSLGNCQIKCAATFAYAVVQGENCWCSNYAPANTVDLTQCDTSCPGYPYEQCGSTGNNLFGYLALNIAPSGTLNAQTTTPSTTPTSVRTTPVSTPLASTGFSSLTSPPQTSKVTSSTTTVETVDVTVTAEDSGSTTTPAPKTSATPYTTQSLATISGSVVTSFVTVSPTSAPTSAPETTGGKPKMSSGSIIAIAVASVVAAIVLFAALIIGFCCWRRKQERSYTPETPEVFPKRTTSVLSKAGLLGTPATSNTNSDNPQMLERRSSRPMVFDQRLNPSAIMQHDEGSRTSFVSMQDNRDYTRTLNVRNPDPAD